MVIGTFSLTRGTAVPPVRGCMMGREGEEIGEGGRVGKGGKGREREEGEIRRHAHHDMHIALRPVTQMTFPGLTNTP